MIIIIITIIIVIIYIYICYTHLYKLYVFTLSFKKEKTIFIFRNPKIIHLSFLLAPCPDKYRIEYDRIECSII